MKRFLLFASYEKYDYGKGWDDFRDDFASIPMAMNYINDHAFEWWQIVDTKKLVIVREKES